MSAAMVSACDMGVAAAPTAAAASEAGMSTSVSATMAAAVAAATSAGGRKRWGKGDGSAERCGRDDSDHTLSRHGGVILSGYPIHQA